MFQCGKIEFVHLLKTHSSNEPIWTYIANIMYDYVWGYIYIYAIHGCYGNWNTRNFTIYLCLAYLPRIWGLWHFTNLQFAQSLTQMIHMYGTFAYMYPLNYPNVGKLTMHWVSSLAKPCMCHASWQRVGGFGGFRKTFGSSRTQISIVDETFFGTCASFACSIALWSFDWTWIRWLFANPSTDVAALPAVKA